jgi:release factor glutamine methyltransferase
VSEADSGAGVSWTVRRILEWTRGHFEKHDIDAPRLTAELLLGHLLQLPRVKLYMDLDRPLNKDELAQFRALIQRRLKFEPTQYLTQKTEFYGHSFLVDSRVLIPRPETELLVEAIVAHVPKDVAVRVLDLCTGSGCVAISLALARPLATVWATDVSPEALTVAKQNAERLEVGPLVSFFEGSLWEAIDQTATFDAIVSNPPYIKTAALKTLQAEVQLEPALALDGGPDGLGLLEKIASRALQFLKPGGKIALEHGDEQGDAVKAMLVKSGFYAVHTERDLARLDRLTVGFAPGPGEP